MKVVLTVSIALLACLLLWAGGCRRTIRDKVITVSANDVEMNNAILKARSTLPLFWSKCAEPREDESDFCLKVEIKDTHGTEFFWCIDLQKSGDKITGVINNDPNTVHSVKLGQRISISEHQIADWLYKKGDKMIGNYTLRPLMRTMDPQQRTAIEARLGELP